MSELWDLYDKEKHKLNKTIRRGDKLKYNEFHLVVNAWIVNDEGKFLIARRSPNKPHPLFWECTGGSALKGEDGITASLREVKEELGIDLDRNTAKYIGSTLRYYPNCNDILEVWLFKSDVNINDVKIQEEEVNDVMWATKDDIIKLYDEGKFDANIYIDEIINGKY